MAQVREYRLQQGDTPQRVALALYRDASKWDMLVNYNKLEEPYFLPHGSNFQREAPASGVVRFNRVLGSSGAIIVPAGTKVATPMDTFGIQRVYRTVLTTTMPNNSTYVDIQVECLEPGVFGNVAADSVTTLLTPLTGIGTISNASDFTNGRIWAIKFIGESILLPIETVGEGDVVQVQQDYLILLGKTDFTLTETGEFEADNFANADVATSAGLANVAQALQHRLDTEKGELVNNPDYGTNLHAYIGTNLPFTEKLIELEIVSTLQADPRVAAAQITKMARRGKALEVEALVVLVGRDEAKSFDFALNL